MKPKRTPLDSLPDERARQVLRGLHAEAGKEHMRLMRVFVPYLGRMLRGKPLPWERLEGRFDRFYMSTSPEAGVFTYLLARAIEARRIVEYGTSFGVSTIYLALAVRDNGGGLVYGTELVPAKADAARRNLKAAGVGEYVEVLEGNAVDTLKTIAGPIDFMMNDGWPSCALEVTKIVAPLMRRGAILVNHNTVGLKGDLADYVAYVRDPANGFVTQNVLMKGEISVRVVDPLAAGGQELSQ